MNDKKMKLALLHINNKNNEKLNKGNTLNKLSCNRNNKIITNSSFNNSSINKSNLGLKKTYHLSLSQNKFTNFNIENYQNNNDDSDILRDSLIKVKEKYNEKSNELYSLQLRYNKLNKFNRDNLKLLYTIMKKAGIAPNKEDIINNLDISQILKKEEQESLKEKHLISCFKSKLLEYKKQIDAKENEITEIRKASRITKLAKLQNDNACKSLENINLTIEKDKLNNKISNMETIMNSLNNKCYRLRKSENRNMIDIGELTNKIQNLSNDIKTKDKIIENLTKRIKKQREDKKSSDSKTNSSWKETNYEEEKKKFGTFLKEKKNYEKNIDNFKKKFENVKKENEEFKNKYEELKKEKDKLILMKDEIKQKIQEKEKEIESIEDKIKSNDEKIKEDSQKIKEEQKPDNNNQENENENLKILNNIYKQNEQNYLEEIDLLKQKILKLEEKNNLFNDLLE